MNISFEGKVALVTGAASGLGLATTKAFAQSGASVALAGWNDDAARAVAEELTAQDHTERLTVTKAIREEFDRGRALSSIARHLKD